MTSKNLITRSDKDKWLRFWLLSIIVVLVGWTILNMFTPDLLAKKVNILADAVIIISVCGVFIFGIATVFTFGLALKDIASHLIIKDNAMVRRVGIVLDKVANGVNVVFVVGILVILSRSCINHQEECNKLAREFAVNSSEYRDACQRY